MNTKELVTQLKQSNQDFEFYPTTKGIVARIYADMRDLRGRVLDIGAGNGNFFTLLDEQDKLAHTSKMKEWSSPFAKYAIEKSPILLNQLPLDVFVVGTDFRGQTLLDKQMDVIFCNPPYSQYEDWAEKIIKQAFAKVIYLVIPQRWKDSVRITRALESRNAEARILGSFDFLEADRMARAKVDILKIQLSDRCRAEDPFDMWFNEAFQFQAEQDKCASYIFEEKKRSEIEAQLVKGQNVIERLAELYGAEIDKLVNNYRSIEQLDAGIFKELNVSVPNIKESLKARLQGTKNIYWKQLFDHLTAITDRLTTKSRQDLLGTLCKHTSVDYTVDNAYAVVLWAIKNANLYLDQQLKDMYLWMASPENVINYKSNKRPFEKDRWRWKESTKYRLDYRLVFRCNRTFSTAWGGRSTRMNDYTCERINDIITIGKNLGFSVCQRSLDFDWQPGKSRTFTYLSDGQEKPFMQVKAFLNGNIHCQFCQEFSKAFNIESGRVLGWIRSAQEATQEMDIPLMDASKYFRCQRAAMLGASNIKLLA